MPPNVTAELESVIALLGGSIVLNFTLGDDANPPIDKENIATSFNGNLFQPGDSVTLKSDRNILCINISSLALSNQGVYAVMVETIAGQDTANTSLTIYGEEIISYIQYACMYACMHMYILHT